MSQLSGTILRKKNRPLMGRLNQAYVSLLLTPQDADGTRTVSLARFGRYEVRLTESLQHAPESASALALRLYRRDIRSLLAHRACDDLDQAHVVAEQLLQQARQMNQAHV